MNVSGVKEGDIVRVNKKGFVFLAEVRGTEKGALRISPIVHNISFLTATSREVEAHWRKSTQSRR